MNNPARVLMTALLLAFLVTACIRPAPVPAEPPPPPLIPSQEALREAVSRYRAEFAPDDRVVVFEVTVEQVPGGCVVQGTLSDAELARGLKARLSQVPHVTFVDNRLELLPAAALGDRTRGLVTVAVSTLGIAPGKNQNKDAVTQAVLGDALVVLREKDGWFQVRMADDYLGWIAPGDFVRLTSRELEQWLGQDHVEVRAKTALAHSPGGIGVGVAHPGVRLPLAAPVTGAWVQVRLPQGGEAYLAQDAVTPVAVPAARLGPWDMDRLLELAKSYLGVPYLWAGTTPAGFDCSGFTQRVYSLSGYLIPRDSDMQLAAGVPVERKDLRPGDLVFFARSAGEARPSHVGIYLGDGEYIHASSSHGKVAINSLTPGAPRYDAGLDARYCAARRVIR